LEKHGDNLEIILWRNSEWKTSRIQSQQRFCAEQCGRSKCVDWLSL